MSISGSEVNGDLKMMRLRCNFMSDLTEPREQYKEYVSNLSETDDLEGLMSYEEWLEEELYEMWEEYGSSYL